MSLDELTHTRRPELARGQPCIVVIADPREEHAGPGLASMLDHTPPDVPVVVAAEEPSAIVALLDGREPTRPGTWVASADSTTDVDRVLALLAPADVVLVSEPCLLGDDWLERMRAAARADSNTASASALADAGSPLGLAASRQPLAEVGDLAGAAARHSLRLRPRLSRIVGPCVYLTREALELCAPLDGELDLRSAIELDFAQRCVLSGLAHVAADDVVVVRLAPRLPAEPAPSLRLLERYPQLGAEAELAASGVLPRALEGARRPRVELSVTIDARAVASSLTGTQRHVVELVRALAQTAGLRLRLVTAPDISMANHELLSSLGDVELLGIEEIVDSTPRSTIFHRPQQVFELGDLQLALRLGERLVLNQLDLISYRNPGYHATVAAWRAHRRVSRQALAAADQVIVFSEHTRGELLSDELVETQRVRVIPPGLNHRNEVEPRAPEGLLAALATASAATDPEAESEAFGGFLFCLGTDFRHKNRVFALRVMAALKERHGWSGLLVFAGTHIPHGSSRELEGELLREDPALRESMIDLGPVEDQEMAWLMSHSAAVLYPSTYEGFGLVPLEAALSGVPCIFAARSSLADVLPAEAARIVPWDPVESADRVHALLTDERLRASHVERLASIARELKWADAAASTLAAYEDAAIAPIREAAALSRDEIAREHETRELIAAHDKLVRRLVAERKHAQEMYDVLHRETGFALGLIGPNGSLPEDVQRALLALAERPGLSGPLYGATARAFRLARRLSRATRDSDAGG